MRPYPEATQAMPVPFLALVLMLQPAAAREPVEAQPARPPLCRELRKAFKNDAPRRDVVAAIERATDVTAADVECLRSSRLPGYVVRKAQAQLVKRHGVAALPSGPIDLWAVIPDPRAIAVDQVTVFGVLASDLGSSLGLMDSVEDTVVAQILGRARAAFAAEGVDAEVTLQAETLAAVIGTTWVNGTKRPASVEAGVHYVLHVHIPDAVAAARAAQGDLLVGLGARTGMDIAAMVEDVVRQTVWTNLNDNGVPSVLVELGPPAT